MPYADEISLPALWRVIVIASLSALVLQGCEAPLNLNAVRNQAEQAIQRTDFFQAMARNQQAIVLAGNSGALLVSSDEGGQWQRVQLPTDDSFLSLSTCPDQSFIALTFDNQVWHGMASGKNWTPHDLPSQEQMMTATCAPDGSWWVGGSFTTLQHSGDRGESWSEFSLNEDAILTNLQFLDAENGVATGEYGLVLETSNGGTTWDYAGYLPNEFYPHASLFTSAEKGYVGGLNGFIYATYDGGESWKQQPTDRNTPIFGFINSEDGLFALGENATVMRLENDQWQSLPTPNQPLYLRTGVITSDAQLLVAGGRGLVFQLDAFAAGKEQGK